MTGETIGETQGRGVGYSDGETHFEGFLVVPQDNARNRPCIVLAHDWSGLTDPTKKLAQRYAALGYACFALDVYGKNVRGDPTGDNAHLMAPLMSDRNLLRRRLLAGYEAAGQVANVDKERMAAVGYCFGGLCALDLARAGPQNLRSVVSFHGGLDAPELDTAGKIYASILLLHGWDDPLVPRDNVSAIANELTKAGADWQLHIYGHAKHAFTFKDAQFPDRGILYDPKADQRSWAAMRRHLDATLVVP